MRALLIAAILGQGLLISAAYHHGRRDGIGWALSTLDYVEVRPGVFAAWVKSGALR